MSSSHRPPLDRIRQVAFGFADPKVELLLREALRSAEERQALVQQFTAAEAVIGDGLAFVERTGERHSEAELYRLRGVLCHRTQGDAHTCAADPRRAVECARARGARWSELRAAMALAQFVSRVDRREVGATLASALSHFETDDPLPIVAEARATLAELG